ncbi:poly(A) RNA polymerase gld-2 homolog A-like isoform X2 [Diabrotica virgifera virgifera]|uniref:Poly(A) RNA polymerase gld-2 homolog A-like isoform X2 n=1 Tax=Diabrotica virgifera virgifera TaxID=50390 RepID=A0A6P7F4X6_DIAVI|nr:poly(A) RNA polymerase gld-2 homolog A-like isoform X2 [Diabrotica virgifera virgifera]
MDIEMEPQVMTNNKLNLLSDTMFYDILSKKSYPLSNYRKHSEKDKSEVLNNNKELIKLESDMGNLEVINPNVTLVSFPLTMMPPPPHKIVNYNNNKVKQYHPRDSPRQRDNYRPISPKGYDSDESCTSYSSRETPPESRVKHTNLRSTVSRADEQTIVVGKYCHNSPNVYHSSNIHYHVQHNHSTHNSNGHYSKNRYYTNSNNNNHNHNHHNSNSNGRQKYNGHSKNNMDTMIKRAHGLVERFKSRAEMLKIEPNPLGLSSGGPWDQLNQEIWDLFINRAQKEKTYDMKINLWKNLFLYIRKCLSSYGLFMVGSTMSGFGLESSDIDMCLLTKPCTNDPRLDSLHHLDAIRELLVKNEVTADPELILAKVPILKFKDKETGFEIDLNCNNAVGIRNTHLLYSYARLDWRVRPLVIIVKIWAQANNINDAKNMTVSSYSWALMVIHYLQRGVVPPVLPCLHGLIPDKFNSFTENHSMDVQEELPTIKDFQSDNSLNLAELLIGFFRYYTNYDFNHYAISVRTGSSLPIDECRFTKAPKNDPHQWKFLCIEEPFDHTNTARSVFDLESFKLIKNSITASYEILVNTKNLCSILPVNGKSEVR